jgi:hypothetical protein
MTVQDLLEIEAIKQLKYAYMRCVDKKLWDEMTTLFVPEATCSYSAGHYTYEGRDAIVAWLRKGMDKPGFHSTHSVHHPEIRLAGPAEATGVWKLEDYVLDTDYDIVISGAAFYEDRYVKRGRPLADPPYGLRAHLRADREAPGPPEPEGHGLDVDDRRRELDQGLSPRSSFAGRRNADGGSRA